MFVTATCFDSAYTQINESDIVVELMSDASVVKKTDSIAFRISVQNKSLTTLYLVTGEKARPGYNRAKKELGLGFDMQPANFHYFEFPKLKKLKPHSKTEFSVTPPVSSWTQVSTGKWTVDAYVGILEEKKLKNKLNDLGVSLKDKVRMPVTDFLELQSVFYSNLVEIEIIDG